MTHPPSEAVKEIWQLRNAIAELFRPDDFRDTKWQNVFLEADALITAHDAEIRREALIEAKNACVMNNDKKIIEYLMLSEGNCYE